VAPARKPRGGLDATATASEVDAALRALGSPDRAVNEKAYLKSDLDFYGVSVPGIRSVVKAFAKQHAEIDHDDVVAIAVALWEAPVHERRMAAVELLSHHASLLGPDDMPLLERLLRESRTWAFVDNLAGSIVGSIVERHAELADRVLDRWASDDDFWIRRSALLALLGGLRGGEGDFARFSRYADSMLDEKEFFIRKAIGWVLRETAKKRPDLVYEWLLPRATRASGVTVREAVKPLSESQRTEVIRLRTSP
jgi:3-methyladenine DNA glycosylase AlkD